MVWSEVMRTEFASLRAADGRAPVREVARDRLDGGLLGQSDHPRRSQHRYVTAAQCERGVGFRDDERHRSRKTGGQCHARTIGT